MSPTKTVVPVDMLFRLWTRVDPRTPCFRWGRDPSRKQRGNVGVILGVIPTSKCIWLCEHHMSADLSAEHSTSWWKHSFRMDSPAEWVTSARAMRPFVKILCHLFIGYWESAVLQLSYCSLSICSCLSYADKWIWDISSPSRTYVCAV